MHRASLYPGHEEFAAIFGGNTLPQRSQKMNIIKTTLGDSMRGVTSSSISGPIQTPWNQILEREMKTTFILFSDLLTLKGSAF
jgi:hypothetical protein